MLKRINGADDESGAKIPIREASFPAPFISGLEYGSPARGAWNIVHTAMLVPGGHQIYICAAGCLRGVVLTAAEMKEEARFSSISIRENNVLDGDMENLIIDGVTDTLNRLPKLPPAALIYTSCIHHFIGCDLPLVYRELRSRFPNVDFAECYMNPTMRKSGLTPDELTRRSIYTLLKEKPLDPMSVNIIGNDLPIDNTSELTHLVKDSGKTLRDITRCHTYEEFQEMAKSALNLVTYPSAKAAAMALEKRLGQKWLYIPLCYGTDEIRENLDRLADALSFPKQDYKTEIAASERALSDALQVIGDTPIAIDYTATPRPLGLARLLAEHGFHVERVYLDAINGEEKADFDWLRENRPELTLYATVHAKMRFLSRSTDEKIIAIGQKAAYFTGTANFVNIIEGGGMYGFDGIQRLAGLLTDACQNEKDTRKLIQIKGWGCGCCS